ncbi:MAG: hypothetical protein AB2L12_01405 [Smithellaceae bacterium]
MSVCFGSTIEEASELRGSVATSVLQHSKCFLLAERNYLHCNIRFLDMGRDAEIMTGKTIFRWDFHAQK